MAEEQDTPKNEAKIIAFAGPKEGAGKTTLVLNLALGWAGIQKRPVLIVPLDPLARQEHSFYLDIKKPVSVSDILQTLGNTSIAVVGGLLRGKISMSQWGVGVLPLGNTRAQVSAISPKILIPILSRLSQTFDIFLDVESSFPMQAFSFDIADKIFWVSQATRTHLNSTVQLFNDYKEQHYPMDRVSIICNAYDMPGSIPYEEVERFYSSLGREMDVFLPWDEDVMATANRKEVEIITNPQSEWVKVISPPTPIRRPCSDASIVSGKMYVTGAYCSHVYTTGSKWSSCPWLMNTNTSLKWLSVSGVIRCAAAAFSPAAPSSSQTPAAFRRSPPRTRCGSSISPSSVLSRMSTPSQRPSAFHRGQNEFYLPPPERSHAPAD